jgi:hypothetical protein
MTTVELLTGDTTPFAGTTLTTHAINDELAIPGSTTSLASPTMAEDLLQLPIHRDMVGLIDILTLFRN